MARRKNRIGKRSAQVRAAAVRLEDAVHGSGARTKEKKRQLAQLRRAFALIRAGAAIAQVIRITSGVAEWLMQWIHEHSDPS